MSDTDTMTAPAPSAKVSKPRNANAKVYGANTAAEAARALGIADAKTFRARVRTIIGKQDAAKSWSAYWSRANVAKVLADKSIARMAAKGSGKATRTPRKAASK